MVSIRQQICNKKRSLLLLLYGGCCQRLRPDGHVCGSMKRLEFAHIKKTPLNGRGRGSQARVRDIIAHPLCYMVMCHNCHVEFDAAFDVWSDEMPELLIVKTFVEDLDA